MRPFSLCQLSARKHLMLFPTVQLTVLILYSWNYTSMQGFQFSHVTKEQNGIHPQESKCSSGLAGMKLKVVFCLRVLQPRS